MTLKGTKETTVSENYKRNEVRSGEKRRRRQRKLTEVESEEKRRRHLFSSHSTSSFYRRVRRAVFVLFLRRIRRRFFVAFDVVFFCRRLLFDKPQTIANQCLSISES